MANEISVKCLSISNIPQNVETYELRVSVVGIGQTGAEIAQSLSQSSVRLTCHEVSTWTEGGNGESLSVLIAQLAQDDLVFLVWGALDASEAGVLRDIAKASCGESSMPLLIGVTSEGKENQALADAVKSRKIGLDTLFLLPDPEVCANDQLWPAPGETPTTFMALARHLITILTQLSQQKNLICVDLNDVALIMRSGSIGRMGIGVATGKDQNEIATQMALEALKSHMTEATGLLGILRDGKQLSIENFERAVVALYSPTWEERPFMMGLVYDNSLENRVEITVLSFELSY